MAFSFQSSTTGAPLDPLPKPDTNDTLEWAKVQAVRKNAKLLNTSAGQPLPPITQPLTSVNDDGTTQTSTFKLESSPKWFTLLSTEVNQKGEMVVQLGTIVGKATATGRIARVGSVWSGNGNLGSGQRTEYYYQIASAPSSSGT